MKTILKLINLLPYFYFLGVIAFWFTDVNRLEGILAYPILLLGIPLLWQLIKPNTDRNFSIGVIFFCISSYLMIAHFLNIASVFSWAIFLKSVIVSSGLIIGLNLLMSLWIVRNSTNKVL